MLKLQEEYLFKQHPERISLIKTPFFSINHLSKTFTQANSAVKIFDDISYTFNPKLSYALMGCSGTGKSTLLHMMVGIDHPSHGTISLGNDIVSSMQSRQRIEFLQKSVSIVLQQPYLINELTVLENVMLKEIIRGNINKENQERAYQFLAEVDLQHKAHCFPSTLSGGQQQRIAILRAILLVPQFLLVDEPTGNLDEITGQQIINLLLHYKKKYDMGLIISTHDIKIAHQCDVILKIEHQKLI